MYSELANGNMIFFNKNLFPFLQHVSHINSQSDRSRDVNAYSICIYTYGLKRYENGKLFADDEGENVEQRTMSVLCYDFNKISLALA